MDLHPQVKQGLCFTHEIRNTIQYLFQQVEVEKVREKLTREIYTFAFLTFHACFSHVVQVVSLSP